MMRYAMLMVIAALPAFADPVRTDPAENITVFTDADGAHIVTLVGPEPGRRVNSEGNLRAAAHEDELGKLRMRKMFTAKLFLIRTRFVDGRLICEKFGGRQGNDPAKWEARAKELFAESCS